MTTLAALPARCGLGASTSRRSPTIQRGAPYKRSIRARASGGSVSGLAEGAATLAQAQTLLLPGPMAALDCVSCTPTLASAVLTLSGSLQKHPVVAARVAASTATAAVATPSATAAADPTATTTTATAFSASVADAAARSATATSFGGGARGELAASFTATPWTCPANLLVSMQMANPLAAVGMGPDVKNMMSVGAGKMIAKRGIPDYVIDVKFPSGTHDPDNKALITGGALLNKANYLDGEHRLYMLACCQCCLGAAAIAASSGEE